MQREISPTLGRHELRRPGEPGSAARDRMPTPVTGECQHLAVKCPPSLVAALYEAVGLHQNFCTFFILLFYRHGQVVRQ